MRPALGSFSFALSNWSRNENRQWRASPVAQSDKVTSIFLSKKASASEKGSSDYRPSFLSSLKNGPIPRLRRPVSRAAQLHGEEPVTETRTRSLGVFAASMPFAIVILPQLD
jgi:hypothetical protein